MSKKEKKNSQNTIYPEGVEIELATRKNRIRCSGSNILPKENFDKLPFIKNECDHTAYALDDTTIHIPGPVYHINSKKNQNNVVQCVVYFMDKSYIKMNLVDGENMNAGDLFEESINRKGLPLFMARQLFSLWIVSDYLELQLKPNHIPFKYCSYWEELLELYSDASDTEIERDEPILMIQRNIYFPKEKEENIEDINLNRLLYYESFENIIDARYPISIEECDNMCGLSLLINNKVYDQNITNDNYKKLVPKYFPFHRAKPALNPCSTDKPHFHLKEAYCLAYRHWGNLDSTLKMNEAYISFLNECRKLPFYGAAYFRGQIEHPKMGLSAFQDDPVYIAINPLGLFIIDMDDVKFLIGIPLKKLHWQLGLPNSTDKDCFPSLFITFTINEKTKSKNKQLINVKRKKILQIFSKEAQLCDALINSCILLREKMHDFIEFKEIIKGKPKDWSNFVKNALKNVKQKLPLK
ncbi:FERM domain-containing protein 8 [Intoshia linei]|uniref:FERM domain-containing protein 8 n=1 Tax=Intoshia linei TaxID=1819745 RepID=A0A177BD00_9BILA|nr:FERM domain-containing protein 8 [Intoshia linei]